MEQSLFENENGNFAKPVLYAVCFNFLCGGKTFKLIKND